MLAPALAILVAVLGQPSPLPRDAVIIARAKKAIVRDIEPTLPRVTLEAWLRDTLGPGAATTWEVNDCGEHPGNASQPGRDYPVCVEVRADVAGNRRLSLMLMVGMQSRLVDGPPKLRFGSLDGAGPGAERTSIGRLAQLPALIER